LFSPPAAPIAPVATALASPTSQARSFGAFLADLALESHSLALTEAGFASIASLAALNPESADDLARLPPSIPFLSKKKMLYRAAIEAPTPPAPAAALLGLRSASSATLRPFGSRPPPPPPVSELTNPRKPKPPPPAAVESAVNERLALLSHPAPPLPPSPAVLRRVTTGDTDAPQPPPAALKKDMLKKLKPINASADDLSDAVRPPAELGRSKSGVVPTVSHAAVPPRALSPPPPAASDELATSPRRHHSHHHHHGQSSPSKSSKREKSSKDKSSVASSRTSGSKKAPPAAHSDDDRPVSTSPPPPPPSAPAAPAVVDVETDEYKAMLKASKKAKLARIFGARPASNVIDAEVAALATRQLAPSGGDEQCSDDGGAAPSPPPPKSTSPGPPLDDESRHALVAKQRKKSKLEKVFGVRPASFLLSNDGKADELPALLRSADAAESALTADDDSSSTLSDDFDAEADEKRRAASRLTLQIQIPEHQMYKTMDFPADWTVAQALVAIRSKIPALSEQQAFVMTRLVDSTDVPLRTTQSMRVFSKTEANVVKLCLMSRDSDAAAVPEGPRHWDRGTAPSLALSSSGRMLSLLRKSTTSAADASSQQPPKLMAVLLDPELNAKFDLFLRHRHAEESLRCWGDIQDFKLLTSQPTRLAMAKAIYDKYIRRDAIDEVNLNDTVRREVSARRRIAAVDLFETTEDALVDLMRERYLEFLKSIGF
jgi:hypothetical protein